jgi:hypothetical protein
LLLPLLAFTLSVEVAPIAIAAAGGAAAGLSELVVDEVEVFIQVLESKVEGARSIFPPRTSHLHRARPRTCSSLELLRVPKSCS